MRSGLFNRQSFLELSLLAVFAAGLLIARLVVDSRSRILLGPGIQLIGSGLTVHLPVQRGWQGLTQWQYERDNSFVLPARLASRLSPVMDVYWMYKLNTTAHNSRQMLEELASEAGRKLQDVQDIADAWPMKYGRLSTLQDGNERYIGTVPLDFGRVLVLQVQSGAGDPALAKEVFLTLARSVRYETPAELARGVELLQKARRFETKKFFSSLQPRTFLIRDAAGSVRGYETVQVEIDSQGRLRIDKTTVFNTAALRRKEHLFESSRPFETFDWRCQDGEISEPSGGCRLQLKEGGVLTREDSPGQTRVAPSGPATVSEILLDSLVRYFLETEQQKTVVDILYADGLIIPAQMSSIPLALALAKGGEMAFAVRADSLNGATTEFYFTADKKPLGKVTVESRRGILLWEPAELKEIEKHFNTQAVRKGATAKNGNEKKSCLPVS